MSKYFNDCNNIEELKKKYIKLIKKYHPDSATNEYEFNQHNQICAEINSEYELLLKTIPKISLKDKERTDVDKNFNSIQEQIINGNESAQKAIIEITNYFNNYNIDKEFYGDYENAVWWYKEMMKSAINGTIKIFWNTCLDKKIIGNEFDKLFEICNYNAEKMKRTIMFLSTCAISEKDIHTNLTMDNPIPFFDDNIPLENLPNYNSFLIIDKDVTKQETKDAWIEFCQKQRDNFHEKFYDIVYQKISNEKHK